MLHKSINKRGRIKTRITKNREDFWKNRVGPMRGGGGGGGAAAAAVMIATVKAKHKRPKGSIHELLLQVLRFYRAETNKFPGEES
mmetsp:Transcript_11414/g.21814  ORF Transcript_11414/g.21814 Transcript_11414/m.21814 type:complete len:85 (+) Transcript_11414:1762-2016(+)